MAKRIAIVTWWSNLNYGSVLQAYALQRVVRRLGYDSEFVNFDPVKRSVSYKTERFLKDMAILCYKPRLYESRIKIRRFIRENFKVSPSYDTYDDLRNSADGRYSAAICGSDQIWHDIKEPLYFLTFMDPERRISYAPSIGRDSLPTEMISTFREYVNGIRFLSIRERQGAAIIKSVTGRDALVALDPSFLLTKDEWEEHIPQMNSLLPQRDYILCYFRSYSTEYVSYARRLSEYVRLPVVSLPAKFSLPGTRSIVADPFEFLGLVRNATYVLTDSFHGTVFSIIFGRQFGVFRRFKDSDPGSQNSRIYNILEITCLESRLVSTDTPLSVFPEEPIHYDSVNVVITAEREKSLTYLKHAITSTTAN